MLEQIRIAFESFWSNLEETILTDIPKFSAALLVTFIFYLILSLVKRIVRNRVNKAFDDKLVAGFFNRFYNILEWVILIIIFLTVLGKSAMIGNIAGAAGITAFVLGFAFKDIGENFLAGIMLAFQRPFKLGDIISTNGIEGVIKGIDLRETHVKTFDGKDVYIPNGQLLKNPLFNYTIDGFMRQTAVFQVDHYDNLSLAQQIIYEEAENLDDILQKDKSPNVFIESSEPPMVKITVYYWIDTFTRKVPAGEIKSQLIKQTIERFKEAGIHTPNATMEITAQMKEG